MFDVCKLTWEVAKLRLPNIVKHSLQVCIRSYLHRRGHKQATFTFPNMARDHRFIQNLGELHKYFYNKIKIFLSIETYSDLWNNDVGRFWFTHESRKIPVVSLTDTGAYRCWTILCNITTVNS